MPKKRYQYLFSGINLGVVYYFVALCGLDADVSGGLEVASVAADFFGCERNLAISNGKESVVATALYVRAWSELRAALAHDDIAGLGRAAMGDFHAEPLAVGIAAKPCRSARFFMGHR